MSKVSDTLKQEPHNASASELRNLKLFRNLTRHTSLPKARLQRTGAFQKPAHASEMAWILRKHRPHAVAVISLQLIS